MKNLRTYTSLIFSLLAAATLINPVSAQSKAVYHIKNGVQINKTNCNDLTKLIIMLPLAQTNQYQTVSNVNYYNGELLSIPETDDKYLRYTMLKPELQNLTGIFNIFYEFDVSLNSLNFDFTQVTQIYPYNTSSNTYIWYTGPSGDFVVPNNPNIQSAGNTIWSQSIDIIDYARRCYEYVAANFNYLNPNTGLHPLADVLSGGGGDCGNLSSIYISLLRYKNIPSRHVVTIRPDGSYHVWADFYLENYGWIPVDVTYKEANPNGDFFGKYDGNGIVVTKEVWLLLQKEAGSSYNAPLLQNFNWWYWHGSGGCNSITASHYVTSNLLASIQENSSEPIKLFPNPASETLQVVSNVFFKNALVEIYDTNGGLIRMETLSGFECSINLSGLNKGVYILKVCAGTAVFVRKFIRK